jgi:hypothetical protein
VSVLLRSCLRGDALESVHELGQRSTRVELRHCPPAQERFDGGEVAEDLLTLGTGLPKEVGAAPGHTLEDHVGWSAQQRDGVEPG